MYFQLILIYLPTIEQFHLALMPVNESIGAADWFVNLISASHWASDAVRGPLLARTIRHRHFKHMFPTKERLCGSKIKQLSSRIIPAILRFHPANVRVDLPVRATSGSGVPPAGLATMPGGLAVFLVGFHDALSRILNNFVKQKKSQTSFIFENYDWRAVCRAIWLPYPLQWVSSFCLAAVWIDLRHKTAILLV